jgi:hypothetical protein
MSIGHTISTDCFNIGRNIVHTIGITQDLGVHVGLCVEMQQHLPGPLWLLCALFSNMLQLFGRRIM